MSAALSIEAQCALAARLVAERLDGAVGPWRAAGPNVFGPGTTGVGVVEHEGTPDGHVDVGFVLNRERPDAPILWDCAAGAGADAAERIAGAVDTWFTGTWPVIRELLSGRREFAVHCAGDHPLGLPGWHVIRGPVLAFGEPTAAQALLSWAAAQPLLRAVGAALVAAFDRPALNGIKLVLAPGIAEARVNGRVDAAATAALQRVPLPALDGFAGVRCFSLAVSPESATGLA